MSTLFVSAFLMAIAFAAQPGVIAFEALRRGVSNGWQAALRVQFGSLVGDATWALVALIGASILFQNRLIAAILSLFGCALLLRFAWDAWQASRRNISPQHDGQGSKRHFVVGMLLSLSNPGNITFWLGMSGTIIGLGFLNPAPSQLATFFAGYMIAQVCWCFFFAGLVSFGRRLLTPRTFRLVNATCALMLAYLGVILMIETLRTILGG